MQYPFLKFNEDNLFFKYKRLCTYIKVNFVLLLKEKSYVLLLKQNKLCTSVKKSQDMYSKTTMHPINLSIVNTPYLSLEENNFVLMLKIKKQTIAQLKYLL